MKRVRDLANILYYISKIASLVFIVIGSYALLVFILHSWGIKGLPLKIEGGNFTIFLPASKTAFLLGDYTTTYLSASLSVLALYAVFLWLLAAVFSAFKQQKVFVTKSVKHLRNFYRFNFYVPILYILCLILFKMEFRDGIVIVLLHLMLSVFIFFMATFFQQGLVLQEEQDQTL
jgi:hypothetical protein